MYIAYMLTLLVLLGLTMLSHAAVPDLALVTRQFCDYQLQTAGKNEKPTEIPPEIVGYLAKLDADGAWADLDYQSRQMAVWPGLTHMSRILAMTITWKRSVAGGKAQHELLDGIHKGFAHWVRHDYQSPNWWYNQIGAPQIMLPIALLLGEQLLPEERAYLTRTVLPRVKIGMTGQNRVWLAGNTLLGGLLQRDEKLVREAADAIFSEVVVMEKEGIQPDYSFHQHGPQQQFGNYGLSFAVEMVKWGEILRGSPWAMPAEKLLILRRYLLDGERWVCWRGKMDISSCGRQLSPGSPESKARAISRAIGAMARLDLDRAGEYAAIVRSDSSGGANTLIGNRYFWRSDYLVHRRPDYCATLKMCSARTTGAESINSENLSGYYLADGALYLYRTGDEYKDIFPVWNWRQLPGVTCPQKDGPLPAFVEVHQTSTFVGVVSDGTNGCAVLDYHRDGVAAKKAWFFVGDLIVCLGAGIQADDKVGEPLATMVNQCLLHGPVRVSAGNAERTLEAGTKRFEDLTWIEHDGVRYLFPEKQTVVVSNTPQTGNWRKVLQTSTTPKDDVTRDIFSLRLEHGIQPKSKSYAYLIQPTEQARRTEAVILQNTAQLQAICAANLVLAVFYVPGMLQYAPDSILTVTQPCLVILDNTGAVIKVWVADPTQKLTTLTIRLDGNPYEVKLPQGGEKGKTQVMECK